MIGVHKGQVSVGIFTPLHLINLQSSFLQSPPESVQDNVTDSVHSSVTVQGSASAFETKIKPERAIAMITEEILRFFMIVIVLSVN
jgi:hypothetical protein